VRLNLSGLVNDKQQGSQVLQPIVQTLKDFYRQAFDSVGQAEYPVLDSLQIRIELFKLFYDSDDFALH
jgi:hypothetical protein